MKRAWLVVGGIVVLLAVHPVGEAAQAVEALVPFIKDQQPLQGKATGYVCKNYVCNLPTSDLSKLTEFLDASR